MTDHLELVPVRAGGGTDLLRKLAQAHVNGPLMRAPITPVNKADNRIAVAQEALEQGRQMIDLRTAINVLGTDHFGYASALRTGERIGRTRDKKTGNLTFRSGQWECTFDGICGTEGYRFTERYARASSTVVPYVPAEAREVVDNNLRGKFIFWEQKWTEHAQRERMHLDPALIEPVVGNLFIVHAVWDLTPLERAALGG